MLGLLGPFGRTVTLPGASSAPGLERHLDDIAIELALQARPPLTVGRELPGLSPYAWGAPEDELLGLLHKRDPFALISCIPPQACISSAVSLVAETPWMNTSLAPPSVDELASPWISRCPENDAREQAQLFDAALELLHCRRPLLVRTGEPFADLHLEWWKQAAAARGTPVVAEHIRPAAATDLGPLIDKLRTQAADVLLCWSDARSTAELVSRLRSAGVDVPVLASAEVGGDAFLEAVGPAPGVVLAPRPCRHWLDAAGRQRFAGHYPRMAPQTVSWASFDAASHLLEALQETGLERESLRSVLQDMRHLQLARLEDRHWR